MAKAPLVGAYIAAGGRLVEALIAEGVPITGALWLLSPELEEWRLLIASPSASAPGPRATYSRIRGVWEQDNYSPVALDDVVVKRPDEKPFSLLRRVIQTRNTTSPIRFSNNRINNDIIEDAWIYLM